MNVHHRMIPLSAVAFLLTACVSQTGNPIDEINTAQSNARVLAGLQEHNRIEDERRAEERKTAETLRRAQRRQVHAAREFMKQQSKCFAPKPEDAPGQAPLRRFMELSHEAEYGTGGGDGGGGGC